MSNPNSPNRKIAKTPEGLTFDDGANTCHIRPRSSIALEVLENRSGFTRLTGGYNPYKWRYRAPTYNWPGPILCISLNKQKCRLDAMKCSYGTLISYRTNDQKDPKRYEIHVDFRVQTYSVCLVYLQTSVTIQIPKSKKIHHTRKSSFCFEFEIPKKPDVSSQGFSTAEGGSKDTELPGLQIGAILRFPMMMAG